jgi:transposase-like protein
MGMNAPWQATDIEWFAAGQMEAHLGYGKHDPVGRDGGNSRNGHRSKTVTTDVGPVEITVPATATAVSSRRSWPSGSAG